MAKMLSTIAVTIALLAAVTPVAAQVQCGDTITEDTRLTEDLTCGLSTVLTLVGPAKLNLAGYTIYSTYRPVVSNIGIVVEGSDARVRNGTIVDCAVGIKLRGEGGHRISKVFVLKEILGGPTVGISSESTNREKPNIFVGNTIKKYSTGIATSHSHDRIARNVVEATVAIDVKHNTDEVRIVNNDISNGFIRTSTGNNRLIVNNKVTSGESFGITSDGDKNIIRKNVVTEFSYRGIIISGADNIIRHNDVSGAELSDRDDAFDMYDSTENCGTNRWRQNTFGTANQYCIR